MEDPYNLERFVDTTNRLWKKGLCVKPLLLLPETVWRSEYRNFLCATCRFYPADPANVFFLAATPKASETMGLPLHPNLSAREAHDVGLHFVGLLGDIYEKMIADGNPERQVASVAQLGQMLEETSRQWQVAIRRDGKVFSITVSG